MALDTDRFLDRRRLKRRLTFWRLVAVAAVLAAVLVGLQVGGQLFGRAQVARIAIDGVILADEHRDTALREAGRDPRVKAVVVVIDSPGGTFVGGEMLLQRLEDISTRKPVVAVMRGTATSAAYMVALGADRVFASDGTVTGSIGVILQTANVSAMLEKLGIEPITVKSGPLKAEPNPLEPFGPEAREATQHLIENLHAVFVDMVAAHRPLSRDEVVALADGRVFAGRTALEVGLVDAVGSIEAAREWLAAEHGVGIDLPLVDIEIDYPDPPWSGIAQAVLGKALFSERLTLDGVISLWQPEVR